MSVNETSQTEKRDKFARGVRGKPASKELLGLQISGNGTASFTLAASGSPGDSATVTMTLSNIYGLRLFGFPAVSLYLNSIASANSIPDGSNITAGDFEVVIWPDWGSTNNNNIKLKAYIRNKSASNKDILFRGNWRFLVEEATT